MATVVDYSHVLNQLTAAGFRSLYYNSGAFGFEQGIEAEIIGWIGPRDPSIRDQAQAWTYPLQEPFPPNLARLLCLAWCKSLPGNLWLMPKSHWAYELDFGNRDWLPEVLNAISINSADLQKLTNAAAIQFTPDDTEELEYFTRALMDKLQGSDFAAVFPAHGTVATLHHHKQIWWQTNSPKIALELKTLGASAQSTQSSSS